MTSPDDASSHDLVLVDIVAGVATLTINRPDRRNALSFDLLRDLLATLRHARVDPAVRVVVITGAGTQAFSAGGDLRRAVNEDFIDRHEARGLLADIVLALEQLGKPSIAKVRGYALAGGFGLALACDLVVANDTAVFGSPEIDVGMWPMMITVPMLRSMPAKVALELQLTGRRVGADEALKIGFVNRIVPDDELDGVVFNIAERLSGKPGAIVRLGRDAFYRVLDMRSADALDHLRGALGLVTQTADHAEGIRAFRARELPKWSHR
jgi:enoyl-CoA hydratase/carnithine racemase